MGARKVYLFRIEVKGLPGCQVADAASGAYVNCVVPASTKKQAEIKLKKVLSEDRYKLISVDKVEDFYSLDFSGDNSEDKEYLQMAKDALKFNEVYYGVFNTWDK